MLFLRRLCHPQRTYSEAQSSTNVFRLVLAIYFAGCKCWYGKTQSPKSKASAAPVPLPDALADVLREYRSIWSANPEGWLFATRNNRPPSNNNDVEYRLWPILDALDIPRCGLHAFRHSVASFIVDAGYSPEVAKQQLRHTDAHTTLNYIHLRGGITEQAMADVSNSLKLDAVGRAQGKGSQYI